MHKQMPIERKRWLGLTGVLAGAALLVFPHLAMALGLGPIQVKSSLNQPLKAEILLIQARGEDVSSADAKVASQQAFERVGLSRNAATNNMQFRVIGDGSPSNPARLLVTTTDVVKEPVLSFLVQLDWPSGKVIREYTVLLDPPVTPATEAVTPPQQRPIARPTPLPSVAQQPGIATSQPRLASGATTGQSRPQARPTLRPEPPRVSQQQPVPRPTGPSRGARQYGPVRPQETLWSIAYKLRPDANRITMDQMQIAILRANPTAFENGNINRVIKGSVLKIPATAEIMAVNPLSAKAEVARQRVSHQSTARSNRRPSRATTPKTTVAATPAAAEKPVATPEKPAASQGPKADSVEQPGEDSSAGTAPKQAAVDTTEADSAVVPTADETEAAETQTDAEAALAAMQEQAEKTSAEVQVEAVDTAAMVDGEVAPAPDSAAMTDADADADTDAEVGAETEAESIFEEDAMADSAGDELIDADETQVIEADIDEFSEEDWSAADATAGGSNSGLFGIVNILGGIAILALLIGALWYNRKRRNKEAEAEFDQYLNDKSIAEVKIDDAKPGPQVDGEPASVAADSAAEETAGVTVADVGTADEVLSEVDMHLAYGLHEECEAMLNAAIATNPDRQDLKLKMLEVHQAAGNAEAYQQVAETLKSELDESGPEWQKILETGHKLAPGAALFAVGGTVAAAAASDTVNEGAAEVTTDTGNAEAPAMDPAVSDFEEILAAAGVAQETGASAESGPLAQEPAAPDSADDLLSETGDAVTDSAGDLDNDLEEGLDFDALAASVDQASTEEAESAPEITETVTEASAADAGLEFNLDDLDFGLDESGDKTDNETNTEAPAESADAVDAGLDFDLSELETPTEAADSEPEAKTEVDPGLDFDAMTTEETPSTEAAVSDDVAAAQDEAASEEDFDALLAMAGQDDSLDDASEEVLEAEDSSPEEDTLIEDSVSDDLSALEDVDLDGGGSDDEASTKLDLARAYIDMGEPGMAESLLQEVVAGGNASQKAEAEELLKSSS